MADSLIIVDSSFDFSWPFAADHFHALWAAQGPVQFIRLADGETRSIGEIAESPGTVTRLASLDARVTAECAAAFPALKEAVIECRDSSIKPLFQSAGVKIIEHHSEGFWGQSVSEFGLALTLCGLRRIPQTHHEILTNHQPWDYAPPERKGRPGVRGIQYGDDTRFTNGTAEGKRVRIVGAGNIASRYASFMRMLGADVAAWDPFASEPCFHRAGSRREMHLGELVKDAEIFVPMVPLTEKTRGLVTADHINALPKGCLVVMVTRADICHMPTVRARVMADELALAADVFDIEPLPLDDPLLGRDNVVHTPHNAGRTRQANERWSEAMACQFAPR